MMKNRGRSAPTRAQPRACARPTLSCAGVNFSKIYLGAP